MSKVLNPCPVFVAGEWRTLADAQATPVHNPSTGEVIAECPLGTGALADEAVQAAHAAFPAWADTPAIEFIRSLTHAFGTNPTALPLTTASSA